MVWLAFCFSKSQQFATWILFENLSSKEICSKNPQKSTCLIESLSFKRSAEPKLIDPGTVGLRINAMICIFKIGYNIYMHIICKYIYISVYIVNYIHIEDREIQNVLQGLPRLLK